MNNTEPPNSQPLTEQEIAEGNPIIAEFMGGVFDPKYTSQLYSDPVPFWVFENNNLPEAHTGRLHSPANLQYHSNDNWLMRAVRKVCEPSDVSLDSPNQMFQLDEMNLYANRARVFRGMVEFAKWYLNKKSASNV